MADPTNGHDEAALAVAARHALHDEELIAALADGDAELEAAESDRARALIERCQVCRDIHADLTAILTAHRAMASLAVAAPRDFRLTAEDAMRLRPDVPVVSAPAPAPVPVAAAAAVAPHAGATTTGSVLGRLRAAFGAFGRPLGGTLVAAGLVGILVGSFSLGPMPAGAPAAPMGGVGAHEQVRESAEPPGDFAPAASAVDTKIRSSADGTTDAPPSNAGALLLGGGGLVVLGLVMLLATRRRRGESP